ncbi:MAG TPA: hypothetical protein DG757_16440 [Bacillus sp. (in: Bacteria)]|nr:hypothetical protein [Bacillus cereus]HCX50578.1 hypothetical protein [Bacillus sp. (in: firmicutes)]
MIYIEFYINYKRNKRFNFQFFVFYILFITIPLMHNNMNIILKEKWGKLIFINYRDVVTTLSKCFHMA